MSKNTVEKKIQQYFIWHANRQPKKALLSIYILCNDILTEKLVLYNKIIQVANISQEINMMSKTSEPMWDFWKVLLHSEWQMKAFFLLLQRWLMYGRISTPHTWEAAVWLRIFGYSYPFSASLLQRPLKSTWSLPLDFKRISFSLVRLPLSLKDSEGQKSRKGSPGHFCRHLFYSPQPPQSCKQRGINISVRVGCSNLCFSLVVFT